MYSTRRSCQIATKLEVFRQTFGKYLNTKFQGNPSSWCRVIPYGWRDRRDETSSHFSQFYKCA